MKFETIYYKDDFIKIPFSEGIECLVHYEYSIVNVSCELGNITAVLKLATPTYFRMLYAETLKRIEVIEFDEDFVIKKIHEKEDVSHR